MTRREQQSRAKEQTPAKFRLTSAFRMKALYQRHMLYGMLVASLVVCLPTIIVAFWPIPPTTIVDIRDVDSIPREVVIQIDWGRNPPPPEPPVQPPTGGPSHGGPGAGNLVDNVVLVDDSVELANDGLALGGAGLGEGDIDMGVDDPFEPVGGGGVYVQDTTTYGLFDQLEKTPELINMPLPEYPAVARRSRMEGKVILHLLVELDGRVSRVKVFADTNPSLPFAQNAIEAALKAVFRPAFQNGVPVRCWVSIPVEYELH